MNICRASFFVVHLNPNFSFVFFGIISLCRHSLVNGGESTCPMFLSVRTTSHHQMVRMKVSRRDFSP